MHARQLATGLVALAIGAFAAGSASAADTVRLSLPAAADAPTVNLEGTAQNSADNVAVHYGFGGFGYRGFGGFGYRGFGGFGYRGFGGFGYRGWGYGGFPRYYGGFYPRYGSGFGLGLGLGYGLGYGLGWRRPWGGYYGGYYGGYGLGYSPVYYSYPSYSSYSIYTPALPALPCLPIAATVGTVASNTVLVGPASSSAALPGPAVASDPAAPATPAPSTPGTYPYDGGPQSTVPMPPAEESETVARRMTKPELVEDLAVSLPATLPARARGKGKWNYPAYGEEPTRQAR